VKLEKTGGASVGILKKGFVLPAFNLMLPGIDLERDQ